MEEKLVSFQIAKLAKEKGFNEKSLYFYSGKQDEARQINLKGHSNSEFIRFYSAPTQGLLQKWLREKHKINVYSRIINSQWGAYIEEIPSGVDLTSHNLMCIDFKSSDDAIEAGLQEALNLIK